VLTPPSTAFPVDFSFSSTFPPLEGSSYRACADLLLLFSFFPGTPPWSEGTFPEKCEFFRSFASPFSFAGSFFETIPFLFYLETVVSQIASRSACSSMANFFPLQSFEFSPFWIPVISLDFSPPSAGIVILPPMTRVLLATISPFLCFFSFSVSPPLSFPFPRPLASQARGLFTEVAELHTVLNLIPSPPRRSLTVRVKKPGPCGNDMNQEL